MEISGMDIHDIQEMLRKTASGYSRSEISSQLGVSKSTVQHYLDRVARAGISLEQATALPVSELESILEINSVVRSGHLEPDFEDIYCRNRLNGKRRKSLKELWSDYVGSAPKGAKTLGYKGFCKAFKRFCKHLPQSCQQVELINQWQFGDVAMIDYSGDGICVNEFDKEITAQIFVAVLPASGFIFCYATPRQTRDDWLDAQVKMLEFFGGVPRHIYLDNSTSLVIKPDKYSPRLCRQYQEFCDYYGTIGVAVRPGKPKDKAMVENAVRQVQQSILNPLRKQKFFGIEDLNRALEQELKKLNQRALTTRSDGVSRFDLMQEEKIALRPLPLQPYELSSISKILKVQKGNVVRFDNVRFSVPLGHIGEHVKVVKSSKNHTVSIFDLRTGERMWIHYLTPGKSQDIILKEHMPERIRSVTMTKEEIIEVITQAGPASKALCELLLKQNHGEVARKVLRGVNSLRCNLGNRLFEYCCEATLKRAVPSYKVLCAEVDAATGPKRERRSVAACDRSDLPAQEVRGEAYYAQLIQSKSKVRK